MKVLTAIAATLALGAFLPGAATAGDYKTLPAAACMPYGYTTFWEDLVWRPSGVNNPTSNNKHVLCWIMQDDEDEWAVGRAASVRLFFKQGGKSNPITCTLTVGSSLTTGATTYSQSITPAANTTMQLQFSSVIGDGGIWIWNPVSVNCRLPPGATLTRITTFESGATHTD